MIVLKCAQDKLLSVLNSIAGIIERRHALPVLQTPGAPPTMPTHARLLRALSSTAAAPMKLGGLRSQAAEPLNLLIGFFSASKLNMRNAP